MSLNENILTKAEFCEKIEIYARDNRLTYLQSILQLCEIYDINIESIPRMITDAMKEKIAVSEEMTKLLYGETISIL